MNAPINSLPNEQSISGAVRHGNFAMPKTQGPSAARRSADLFEQLLALPNVAASPQPAETLPREQAYLAPPPEQTSELSSSSDSSEQSVVNDEKLERKPKEDTSDATSASADAAAAARATSDALANATTTSNQKSTHDLANETTSEESISGADTELESTTAPVPDDSLTAAGLEPIAQATNSVKDEVGQSSSGNKDITTADLELSEQVTTDAVPRAENAAEQDLARNAGELDVRNSQTSQVAAAEATVPVSADEQHARIQLNAEPTSPSERSSKGDRKVGRDKWYERDASKPADKAVDALESEAAQGAEKAQSKLTSSGEIPVEAAEPSVTEVPELAPFVVEAAPSPANSAVSDPILVGAGLTSEAFSNSLNTTSSEIELPDGTFGSSTTNSSRSSASANSQAPTAQPGDAIDLTQQEKIRLIQRVTRSFARLGVDGGQINLRLHPPQLGSLNVQVRLEGRSMTAKLTTETSAARDAIMESLPVLKNRLAEQGFEISQFQVEVSTNDNADATFGDPARERSFDRDAYRQSQHGFENEARRTARLNANQVSVASLNQRGNDPLIWQPSDGIDVQA